MGGRAAAAARVRSDGRDPQPTSRSPSAARVPATRSGSPATTSLGAHRLDRRSAGTERSADFAGALRPAAVPPAGRGADGLRPDDRQLDRPRRRPAGAGAAGPRPRCGRLHRRPGGRPGRAGQPGHRPAGRCADRPDRGAPGAGAVRVAGRRGDGRGGAGHLLACAGRRGHGQRDGLDHLPRGPAGLPDRRGAAALPRPGDVGARRQPPDRVARRAAARRRADPPDRPARRLRARRGRLAGAAPRWPG